MTVTCFITQAQSPRLIHVFTPDEYQAWVGRQDQAIKQWLIDTGFKAEAGNVNVVPQVDGQIKCVVCCVADKRNMWNAGGLSTQLPVGVYKFENLADYEDRYALAWGLGAYQFTRYKKPAREPAKLVVSDVSLGAIANQVEAVYLVRDLINTPTENMGPRELAQAALQLSEAYRADYRQIDGDDLLDHNFPLIHAVGRACDDAPRLLDIRWGNPAHPKVTLVGKGVCFDTGGLDIKTAPYMLLMKKDMGGAAHVLGLARMIMQSDLPVRLRVLIPALENSISASSYRPGDVIRSRKGITVEIGNTDAEGRLVLADAITEAVSENPDLLIDIATLTGAARVAVGTEISAVFANNDEVVNAVIAAGNELSDPVWRLPLFAAYRESLNSTIADINNAGSDSYAGAITAALFLKEFVPDSIPWLHFDIMAWNLRTKPGRPQGGEAMAIRALFAYLVKQYG